MSIAFRHYLRNKDPADTLSAADDLISVSFIHIFY